MNYNNKKTAGLLLVVGAIQCVLGILISEARYPGYSTSIQSISSLGDGPSAIVFNSVVFLLGVLGLVAIYVGHREFKSSAFTFCLCMANIGAVGVGLFSEGSNTYTIHVIVSVITYLFAGIAAVMSYKLQKQPLSILSAGLGVFSLGAMILLASQTYLGLGLGGMERMVAYPLLLWEIGFGSQLISSPDEQNGVKN